MIINFKEFLLETRLSDLINLTGDDKNILFNKIKKEIDKEFSFEDNFLQFYTLKNRYNNEKIRFKLTYFNNIKHDLKLRIKERTSFKDINDFNEILKNMLDFLFPSKLKSMKKTGIYGVYFKEYNITIIFYFNINQFNIKNYAIKIKTIIPSYTNYNLNKTFVI